MARICDNCRRGIAYGQAVSHAKNRVKRLFKPNLQKLKVLDDGDVRHVKFCTSCIQRLKRDSRLGPFRVINYTPSVAESILKAKKIVQPEKKPVEKTPEPALKIEDIVGKV